MPIKAPKKLIEVALPLARLAYLRDRSRNKRHTLARHSVQHQGHVTIGSAYGYSSCFFFANPLARRTHEKTCLRGAAYRSGRSRGV